MKKRLGILLFIMLLFMIAALSVPVIYLNRDRIERILKRPKDQAAYTSELNQERVVSKIAGKPVFSVECGFYEEDFELLLTAEGGDIYYTLDGTDPAYSEDAILYDTPIKIYDNSTEPNRFSAIEDISLAAYIPPKDCVDKGMIIKAAIKDTEGNFGPVVTKSYFVGKDKSYYQNMKVISLVTNPYNLFDRDEGIYVVGNGYYKWLMSFDYDKDLGYWSTENPTNYNQSGKEWERPASIQVFEKGVLAYEQELGIRVAGNASRSNSQKSIRLYARSEYGAGKLCYSFFDDLVDTKGEKIETFDKVTLRNGGNDTVHTMFRDELVQSLVADRTVGVQAEESCILFLDGEFWGMYHLKERIEDTYFASHYGLSKKNVTYIKIEETEGSEEVRQEYEDFYNWAMSADLSTEENYRKVADVIDLQSFMDYFAIETYIVNHDWLYGNEINNILMWRVNEPVQGNPYGDRKWRFVLYDTEYSSSLLPAAEVTPDVDAFATLNRENKWTNPAAVFFRLLDNDAFREDFYENYIDIMENNFNPDRVEKWIDDYTAKYHYAIGDTYTRFLATDESAGRFACEVEVLKEFYWQRPAYALQYLNALCGK